MNSRKTISEPLGLDLILMSPKNKPEPSDKLCLKLYNNGGELCYYTSASFFSPNIKHTFDGIHDVESIQAIEVIKSLFSKPNTSSLTVNEKIACRQIIRLSAEKGHTHAISIKCALLGLQEELEPYLENTPDLKRGVNQLLSLLIDFLNLGNIRAIDKIAGLKGEGQAWIASHTVSFFIIQVFYLGNLDKLLHDGQPLSIEKIRSLLKILFKLKDEIEGVKDGEDIFLLLSKELHDDQIIQIASIIHKFLSHFKEIYNSDANNVLSTAILTALYNPLVKSGINDQFPILLRGSGESQNQANTALTLDTGNKAEVADLTEPTEAIQIQTRDKTSMPTISLASSSSSSSATPSTSPISDNATNDTLSSSSRFIFNGDLEDEVNGGSEDEERNDTEEVPPAQHSELSESEIISQINNQLPILLRGSGESQNQANMALTLDTSNNAEVTELTEAIQIQTQEKTSMPTISLASASSSSSATPSTSPITDNATNDTLSSSSRFIFNGDVEDEVNGDSEDEEKNDTEGVPPAQHSELSSYKNIELSESELSNEPPLTIAVSNNAVPNEMNIFEEVIAFADTVFSSVLSDITRIFGTSDSDPSTNHVKDNNQEINDDEHKSDDDEESQAAYAHRVFTAEELQANNKYSYPMGELWVDTYNESFRQTLLTLEGKVSIAKTQIKDAQERIELVKNDFVTKPGISYSTLEQKLKDQKYHLEYLSGQISQIRTIKNELSIALLRLNKEAICFYQPLDEISTNVNSLQTEISDLQTKEALLKESFNETNKQLKLCRAKNLENTLRRLKPPREEILIKNSEKNALERSQGRILKNKKAPALYREYADQLSRYLDTRNKHYSWRDYFSKALRYVFSWLPFIDKQTEKEKRTAYIKDILLPEMAAYENTGYDDKNLKDILNQGINNYAPRAPIGKENYKNSLQCLLFKVKEELPSTESQPSSSSVVRPS